MNGSRFLFAVALAAGVGAAIAAGSRDTAVGIAIGAAVFAAFTSAGDSRRKCSPLRSNER